MGTVSTKVIEREDAVALLLARIQDRATPNGVLEALMDVAYDDDLHNYVVVADGGHQSK